MRSLCRGNRLLSLLLFLALTSRSGHQFLRIPGVMVAASDEPSDPRFDSAQEAAAAARERMDHAEQAAAEAAAAALHHQAGGEAVPETADAVFEEEVTTETVPQRTLDDDVTMGEEHSSAAAAARGHETVLEEKEDTASVPMTEHPGQQNDSTASGRSLKGTVKNSIATARKTLSRVTNCVTSKAKEMKTLISKMERKDVKKVAAAAVGAWGIAVGVGYLTTPRGEK